MSRVEDHIVGKARNIEENEERDDIDKIKHRWDEIEARISVDGAKRQAVSEEWHWKIAQDMVQQEGHKLIRLIYNLSERTENSWPGAIKCKLTMNGMRNFKIRQKRIVSIPSREKKW